MAELGLTEDDEQNLFWPSNPAIENDLKLYAPHLQCIDENIKIQGAFNSPKAQVLAI